MNSMKTPALHLACVLLVTAGIAWAQSPADPAGTGQAAEIRRYTVEMIIFEYTEDVGQGTEIFVPEAVVTDPGAGGSARDDELDDEPAARRGEAPAYVDLAIRTLPRDALTMHDTMARLERLDAYRPLMHFGWTQATVADEISPELPLARFGTPPPGLDGDLKLYLNRFLHLVVDVSKLAPEGGSPARRVQPPIDTPVDRYGSRSAPEEFDQRGTIVEYEPARYRISEDRIMKNGETRYYDHPKIGVIAKVTRIEGNGVSAGS